MKRKTWNPKPRREMSPAEQRAYGAARAGGKTMASMPKEIRDAVAKFLKVPTHE